METNTYKCECGEQVEWGINDYKDKGEPVCSECDSDMQIVEKDNFMEKEKSIMIVNRYEMYADGVIYDTEQGGDIPQWVFEFRDFCLENYKQMKHNVEIE